MLLHHRFIDVAKQQGEKMAFIDRTAGWMNTQFGSQTTVLYWVVYFFFVFGFTFFYTDVMVQQQRLWETLQKQGGFIPGIRPGKKTQDYIMAVVRRITLVGAVFLAIIAVLPRTLTFLGRALLAQGKDGVFQERCSACGECILRRSRPRTT